MKINDFIVTENTILIDAVKKIDNNTRGFVLVCEEDMLKAVVTDGDIRRHILNSGRMDSPIRKIANYTPYYINQKENIDYKKFMQRHSITALPIVDEHMRVVDIKFLYDKKNYIEEDLNIPVVIMAGGKGTRLHPYTNVLPKPLIPIGDKTITEHIMDKFENFGCKEFNIIVNYKRNLIKSYFMDSEQNHIVEFTDETEYLGTGGGLKLLKDKYSSTFFVTNCDVLIDTNYAEIIKWHKKQKNIITIISAVKNIIIPYGTIKTDDDGKVENLTEKPSFSFLTNTGLYVVEPEFINKIKDNTFVHITDVIQKCIDDKENVSTYPISEHAWLDMGHLDELEKMKERLNLDV